MGCCFSGPAKVPGEQYTDASGGETTAGQAMNGPVHHFGYDTGFSSQYKMGKELGKGQYGTAFICTHAATGKTFAAKQIRKGNLSDQQAIEDVEREVQILRVLKGRPNIVEFQAAFESDDDVVIVLELCQGGELFKRLLESGKYSERDASVVMRQILQAVADCHVNGIIHRDLKPENFLYASLEPNAPLKVTDFGLSDFFSLSDPKDMIDVAGSAYYVAPEILRRKYGPAADLWSCGVIMYILLTGEVPFWAPTEAGIFKQVLTGQIDLSRGAIRDVSREGKQLLLSLLTRDVKARYSAAKALAHPWISQDGVAPNTPLDIKIIENMRRFAGYNGVKKAILVEIAKTFSEHELSHLKQQFALMDRDNSGTITIEEMIQALTSFRTGEDGKPVYRGEEIRKLMKTMDVDNNGLVDYMEFVAATMSAYQMAHGLSPAHRANWASHVRVVFDKIDEDGNGYITHEELKKLLGDTEEVRAMVEEVDKNGDGMIDYEEFQSILRENVRGAAGARRG